MPILDAASWPASRRTDSPIIRCADDLDAGLTRSGLGPADIDRVLGVNAVELIAAVCG